MAKLIQRKCVATCCFLLGCLCIYLALTNHFKIDQNFYRPDTHYVDEDYSLLSERDVIKTYTLKEFKEKVRTDKELLARVKEQDYLLPESKLVIETYLLGLPYTFKYDSELEEQRQQNYDIMSDVMIFLHIQKTGGSHFNRRIHKDIEKHFDCLRMSSCLPKQGHCECLNPNNNMWIYTMAYSGFKCGLHADWTLLHACVPGLIDDIEKKKRHRRYFYFTQLRDAVERYLSEYNFQINHNNWQGAQLGCGNLKNAKGIHVKRCFTGYKWVDVTLDKFMACKDNLATYRVTRMLADLTLAGCYKNFTDHDTMKMRAPIWLESAKRNLQSMEYFSLMEDERASDELFTKTFGLLFKPSQEHSKSTTAGGASIKMTEKQFLKVLQLSELDIHLYLFGRGLFYQRLHRTNGTK
ncbi:heparan sulfate 6-O-sulfotransferase [Mactra antiquata]